MGVAFQNGKWEEFWFYLPLFEDGKMATFEEAEKRGRKLIPDLFKSSRSPADFVKGAWLISAEVSNNSEMLNEEDPQ
jgi:hypothetical protein